MKVSGLLLTITALVLAGAAVAGLTAASSSSRVTEPSSALGGQAQCGDINGDDDVDIADVIYLRDYLFLGGPPPVDMNAADVDLCGSVNLADLTYFLEYFYAGGSPPCGGSVTCVRPTGANQVRLGVPISTVAGDTFDLPIYITNDTPLRGLTIGFDYSSDFLEILDTNFAGSVWVPTLGRYFKNDKQNHRILIGFAEAWGQLAPQGDGLLTTLRVVMHPPFLGESPIDIDSTFIGPSGDFVFCPAGGGVITPAYVDNGEEDIELDYGPYDVSVALNGGANVAYTGQTNIIELWFKNEDALLSVLVGFEFDIACDYEFVVGHGDGSRYVKAEGDAVGCLDLGWFENSAVDNVSPDSISTSGMSLFGCPSHPTHALCYTIAVDIPAGETAVEDGFCVDNICDLSDDRWQFGSASGGGVPGFQGYPNTSVSIPDAPAFCFDIVAPYVCGDADGNSIVNIADAVYLISYIFGGGPAPDPLEAGDADCNAIVNIADAVYLISYIFGGGPAPCASCP